MSAKRPHKLAGRELLAADISAVTDTVGHVVRHTKPYANYSAAEQARIDAANDQSGMTGRGKRISSGS